MIQRHAATRVCCSKPRGERKPFHISRSGCERSSCLCRLGFSRRCPTQLTRGRTIEHTVLSAGLISAMSSTSLRPSKLPSKSRFLRPRSQPWSAGAPLCETPSASCQCRSGPRRQHAAQLQTTGESKRGGGTPSPSVSLPACTPRQWVTFRAEESAARMTPDWPTRTGLQRWLRFLDPCISLEAGWARLCEVIIVSHGLGRFTVLGSIATAAEQAGRLHHARLTGRPGIPSKRSTRLGWPQAPR